MALTLAPSYNQPTVTAVSAGGSAAASTVIAGSPGWLREKRIGVAENSAGGAQTSTNLLDIPGSTRFAYPGLPASQNLGSNPGGYVQSTFKPGDTVSAWWPFNVELITSSPQLAIRTQFAAGTVSQRILVDGLPIADEVTSLSGTAGSGYAILLTFPDSRERLITILGLNNNQGRFGGAATQSGYTIVKPASLPPLMAVIGDSYVAGAAGVGQIDTFAWRLAYELGYARGFINAGLGGSGWTVPSGDSLDWFIERVAPVAGLSPVVVLTAGGRNESTAIQSAVESYIDSLAAALPAVQHVMTRTNADTSTVTINSIAAACAARGVAFLDIPINPIEKAGDGVHPTLQGHKDLAAALYDAWPSAEPPSGGSSTDIAVAATGSGAKRQAGASTAAAAVSAVGAGRKTATGASSTPIQVGAGAAGSKLASGASSTAAQIAAVGGGGKRTSGAGTASAAVAPTGAGSRRSTGASTTPIGITATGDGHPVQSGQGGTTATIPVAGSGDGTKHATGAGSAGVSIAAAGAGTKRSQGGSVAAIGTASTGDGHPATPHTGGSTTALAVLALAAGIKTAHGGSLAMIGAAATGTGTKHTTGAAVAAVAVLAVGAGRNPAGLRDITIQATDRQPQTRASDRQPTIRARERTT